MAKLTKEVRQEIAHRRLQSVLSKHGIATMRTLEQKIADAGPNNQRIDPHLLTEFRQELERAGTIAKVHTKGIDWFYLPETPPTVLRQRQEAQRAVLALITPQSFTKRMGQSLEIAIAKSLQRQGEYDYFGGFSDLDDHDDSQMYVKDEPPSLISGHGLIKKKVDFIARPKNRYVAIEAKNTREWIYPHSTEVRTLLQKSVAMNAIPVLIARRIHFSTYSILSRCGVILHQTYNQMYPDSDTEKATASKDKTLLGYHDIRQGNEPDARLTKFIEHNLPKIVEESGALFEEYKDLIDDYANERILYRHFSDAIKSSGDFDTEAEDFLANSRDGD